MKSSPENGRRDAMELRGESALYDRDYMDGGRESTAGRGPRCEMELDVQSGYGTE